MLYVVSTPIGNLSDISLRAIETLRESDLILCEDTRTSLKLLQHYEIKKPLESYHLFNEAEKLNSLIQKLLAGLKISLISDAGTPLISDPGQFLVQACIEHNISVTPIPGPCSIIQALVGSGFEFERFQFIGFLPKSSRELRQTLDEAIRYNGVSIAFESPHRLTTSLEIIFELNPNIQLCVARELTKHYENYYRGPVKKIIEHFQQFAPKGECVIVLKGNPLSADFSHLSLEEHVGQIEQQFQVSKKEAIKIVAELRSVNKRELYKKLNT